MQSLEHPGMVKGPPTCHQRVLGCAKKRGIESESWIRNTPYEIRSSTT